MATIKTTVAAEVKVEGLDKAGQSVGSFRKQLKEAQQDVINMSNSFGLTSKEAAAAAKKVAELKDRIGDAKALSDTFNPDKKFVALGGALQGVTAGFSAFTGALGLFGDKGKEVEEVLLKVQSAMALQQGISGIKSAVDSFKILATTIKTQVVSAFSTLRGAILTTGIGALVVAVGFLIAKFGELDDAIENTNDEFSDHAIKIKQLELEYKSLRGEISDLEKDMELAALSYNKSLNDISVQTSEKIKKATGWWAKLKAVAIASVGGVSNVAVDLATIQTDAAKEKLKVEEEYNLQVEIIKQKYANKAIEDAKKKQAQEKTDKQKESEENLTLLPESQQKEKEAIEAYGQELADIDNAQAEAERQRLIDNQQRELETKAELAELALLDDPDSIENKIAKENADFALEMANFDGNEIQKQVLKKQHENKITAIEADGIATRQALQQNARMNEINAYQAALGAVADLIGRQTAAGKALAIAEATINVFKAGLQVFSQPMPGIPPVSLGIKIASMVAAIATGIVTVKKIVSTKVPGGGGGGSAPSIPAIPAPIIPRPQTTSLDQQSINAVGNAAARSYVLETDVTNNQERIRRLNRAARIN